MLNKMGTHTSQKQSEIKCECQQGGVIKRFEEKCGAGEHEGVEGQGEEEGEEKGEEEENGKGKGGNL